MAKRASVRPSGGRKLSPPNGLVRLAKQLVDRPGMMEEFDELAGSSPRFRVRMGTLPAAERPGQVFVLMVESRSRDAPSKMRFLMKTFGLSRREAEVAMLLAERLTAKEIARELGVTHHTAGRHTERVLEKMGLSSKRAVESVITSRLRGVA